MATLNQELDQYDWPNRSMSRRVGTDTASWHVQMAGAGPVVLFLHGTGAATHTWRDMLGPVSAQSEIIAPDLPGQGFTEVFSPSTLSLPAMTRAVEQLLVGLDRCPDLIVGHSAGAAIGAQMLLNGRVGNAGLLAINPAMLPLQGPVGRLFLPLAQTLSATTVVPKLFTRLSGGERSVQRLVASTGSKIDQYGVSLYRRLVTNERHVANTLAMMSRWDLDKLSTQLHGLTDQAQILVGSNDLTVAPSDGREVARRIGTDARFSEVANAGHLIHEEMPNIAIDLILTMLRERGSAADSPGPKSGRSQSQTTVGCAG